PIVYGEYIVPGAEQTLMFYVHYDGQPVDPTQWIDHEAFEPVLRHGKLDQGTGLPKPVGFPAVSQKYDPDWRIYARGASDDKAPILGILTAMDALKNAGLEPKNNLRFFFEGEEEISSPNLRSFAENNRELFQADAFFLCDGPLHFSNKPTLDFGVRGITSVEITVYGPNTSLHSGHYGNWAPNPGMRLSKLLASMKDETGRVLIDGFYDSVIPLTKIEMDAISKVTAMDPQVKQNYSFSGTEGGGKSLIEMLQYPSFNVRGLSSGWVGRQSRTIIPPTATASIDMRLVKNCQPRDMFNKVVKHIEKQGYHVVSEDPDHETRMKYPFIARVNGGGGYPAAKTSLDLPIIRQVISTFSEFHNNDVEIIPSLGGSLPLYIFTDILNLKIVGLPIANYDNNQHQPNENIRIGHLWEGIETYAAFLMMEKNSR
ncbi:M20/M25/M40 family metallo-hydrolase, partial [candidate division KSB1 bacterium]